MVNKLTLKGKGDKTWYPASISNLEEHLSFLIEDNMYLTHEKIKPLKKNVAHSLQYIQFLNQILQDIELSSPLQKQNIKFFVVCGASIIEALFHYIVISKGHGATTSWKSHKKLKKSDVYEVKGEKLCNETEIFIQVDPPIVKEMTFDQMCKKVEDKKLLGNVGGLYKEISGIRKLRNKIHLQGIGHSTDIDWWNFNQNEFDLIKRVLYGVLTSSLFSGSQLGYLFDYLK